MQLVQQQKVQAELFEVFAQVQRSRNRERDQEKANEMRNIVRGDPEALRLKLKDKNPLVQLTAIHVIHNRRVPLERELIACLSDPQTMVRESARQALVRLSRGVDFGPKVGCNAERCRQATRRWESWLAQQQEAVVEAPSSAAVEPIDAETARRAAELVQAAGAKESEVLQRLRDAPEPDGSTVLLLAIPDLKGPRQLKARQALADRMSDLDAEAFRKRLTDEDAEVRRAALAAAGKKRESSLIPDALRLLEDPDAGVVQAARTMLKALSGQDFGPSPSAAPPERAIALGRWYQWWVKRAGK